MASLLDVSSPVPAGDGYQLDVVDGWNQGRGAYGGLTIGAVIRAIEHRVGDPARKVRSVTAELPAPTTPGPATIAVDVMRQGSSLTAVRAGLFQGGEVRAHVVAMLAAARPGQGPMAWRELDPPQVPPWAKVPPLEMGAAAGAWPEFAQHFEYRVVEGLPMTGGAPRTVGWVRPRLPCLTRDAGYIASVIDAWWPAALVRFTQLRPLATITFTLDVVAGLEGLDPDAPLLYRGTAPVLADGYFLETRELWGEDGRLVAVNHQTFAVIA